MNTSMRNLSILLALTSLATIAPRLRAGDFNGDGKDDLAIAVDLPLGGGKSCGAVEILFANWGGGLSLVGTEVLYEPVEQGVGSAEDVSFGNAIAIGDFNDDGLDDLAVGAPYAPVKGIICAGMVSIFRGKLGGVEFKTLLHQNSPGMKDKCETNERFGSALASGDFNGDGYCDLAIGVFEKVSGKADAGAVHVVYGSPQGLTADGDQIWNQNSSGIDDSAETSDEFGSVLATGDIDGDGKDELLIGIPGEVRKHKGLSAIGSVAILRGGKKGLTGKKSVRFDAFDTHGASADAESAFGSALAVGDFDGNGVGEVVVGCPGWDIVAAESDDGSVFVIPSKAGKLEFKKFTSFGIGESGRTGRSLAVADYTGDGRDDVAIGMPICGTFTGVKYSGAVAVFKGTPSGIDFLHAQWISRDTLGVIGSPGVAANFGYALVGADFDGNGMADLAISSPFESIGTASACGSINVLLGISWGVTTTGSQYWDQTAFGILSPNQMFGLAMDS